MFFQTNKYVNDLLRPKKREQQNKFPHNICQPNLSHLHFSRQVATPAPTEGRKGQHPKQDLR